MWVRIRPRDLPGLYEACTSEAVEVCIERETETTPGGKFMSINIPYVAAEHLRLGLEKLLFTDTGGRKVTSLTRHRKTLPALAKSMNRFLTHPALKGAGMIGTHNETLPVWSQPADDFRRVWWPMPTDGGFVVLVPEIHSGSKHYPTFTSWAPATFTPDSWLHEEALHHLIHQSIRRR